MTGQNFIEARTSALNQQQEKAIAQALDALCDVAFSLPKESKTSATAISAEIDLRAAFQYPAKTEVENLDDEHRKRFGKAFSRAGKAADLSKSAPHADEMSLRDRFAAKAMTQTMIEFSSDWEVHAYEQESFLRWAAQRAYAMADAMLKAREGS